MLSKVRHYVPKEQLKSIYYAIFSSHMVYGCQVWGQNHSLHLERIFKLQNRALRTINFEDWHADSNPLYIDNKILKLQDFVRLQNCLFIHDYLNNSLPKCFDDYYFKLNSIYINLQTRNSNLGCLFSFSKNTTQYGLNSITQKSINTWNSISKDLNTDLSGITRHKLKTILTQRFIDQY